MIFYIFFFVLALHNVHDENNIDNDESVDDDKKKVIDKVEEEVGEQN